MISQLIWVVKQTRAWRGRCRRQILCVGRLGSGCGLRLFHLFEPAACVGDHFAWIDEGALLRLWFSLRFIGLRGGFWLCFGLGLGLRLFVFLCIDVFGLFDQIHCIFFPLFVACDRCRAEVLVDKCLRINALPLGISFLFRSPSRCFLDCRGVRQVASLAAAVTELASISSSTSAAKSSIEPGSASAAASSDGAAAVCGAVSVYGPAGGFGMRAGTSGMIGT